MKWEWLNHIPKISIISKLTPVAEAGISAAYSWKLVEDVNQKAQQIFSHARSYLQQHQGVELSPIAAYEKSLALLAQATPKLLEHLSKVDDKSSEIKLDQDIQIPDNKAISSVTIKKKTATREVDENRKDEQVEQGLEALAEQMVEPHEQVEPQKPAVPLEDPELDQAKEDYEPELEGSESEEKLEQSSNDTSEAQDETAPIKRKVTKKKS